MTPICLMPSNALGSSGKRLRPPATMVSSRSAILTMRVWKTLEEKAIGQFLRSGTDGYATLGTTASADFSVTLSAVSRAVSLQHRLGRAHGRVQVCFEKVRREKGSEDAETPKGCEKSRQDAHAASGWKRSSRNAQKARYGQKAAAPRMKRPCAATAPAVAEIDGRIAIVRANLRELVEQAASYSGAASEELMSQRIADQEAKLALLMKQREELSSRS